MTIADISADRMFDGSNWHGPTQIRIDGERIASIRPSTGSAQLRARTVLPGLIDVGVSASGYAETPSANDPFAPERAFARMCLRYGVTTIVDVNNSLGPAAYLATMSRSRQGPRVFYSGGRLGGVPTGRHDLVVSPSNARPTIDALLMAGASIVSVGMGERLLREQIAAAACAAGRPAVVGRQSLPETPGFMLLAGSRVPTTEHFGTVNERVWFAPQLHASDHWTVDGMLTVSDAYLAAPVLPHCRNFVRSRGRIGRRIARPIVGRYYGDRNPELLDRTREARAGEALRHRRCLASSAAGATGMVPGLSIWSEMDRLTAIGTSDLALASATSIAAQAISMPDLGRIEVGAHADLILSDNPADGTPSDILDGMHTLVLGDVVLDVQTLADEIDDLVEAALGGSA